MRLILKIKYFRYLAFIAFILSSCSDNNSLPIPKNMSLNDFYYYDVTKITKQIPVSFNDTIYSKVGSQLEFIIKNAPKNLEIKFPNNVDGSISVTNNEYVFGCNFIQDSFEPIELTDKSTNEKFKFYLAGIPDTVQLKLCEGENTYITYSRVISDTIDVEDSVIKNKIETEIKENFIPQNGQLIYNTLARSNHNTITNGSFDIIMGSNNNHLVGSFIINDNRLNLYCYNGTEFCFNIFEKSLYPAENGGWYYFTGQYTSYFKKEYPSAKINKVVTSSLIKYNPPM